MSHLSVFQCFPCLIVLKRKSTGFIVVGKKKKAEILNSLFLEDRSYIITSPAVLLPLTACGAIHWLYWQSSRSLVHSNFASSKICENTWLG